MKKSAKDYGLPRWLWNATFCRTKDERPMNDYYLLEEVDALTPVDDPGDALVMTAKMTNRDERFRVLLDLDIQHHYSVSTNGNGHLILDTDLTREEHDRLLDLLVELRIIEQGYAKASKTREQGGSLRLPWVTKGVDKSFNETKH